MADSEVLQVDLRETNGSRSARRLRKAGKTPAVIYGHGKETVSLAVPSDQVATALRHGAKLVQLQGGVKESAIIRDVQWDAFGNEVLHVDFTRVSEGEKIDTAVAIDLRGDAPGTHEGGTLKQPLHELQVQCPVTAIPDKITINVNELALHDSITAGDIELPEGSVLLTDPTSVIVQCVEVIELEEEVAAPTDGAEPEVIGRKPEDETEGGNE